MFYVIIISAISAIALTYQWQDNMVPAFVCSLIFFVNTVFFLITNESVDAFENKIVSTSKKETKQLIFPLNIFDRTQIEYFIISINNNGAYRFYMQTETGYAKKSFFVDRVEPCNEEHPDACIVKTVTITIYQQVPKYKKFLYYRVVFFALVNKPKETKEEITHTLYVPQNTIIQ